MRHARSFGFAVAALVISATACTELPTADTSHTRRAETGLGYGSGYVVADNQTAATSYETTADTTSRSGLGFGSGH